MDKGTRDVLISLHMLPRALLNSMGKFYAYLVLLDDFESPAVELVQVFTVSAESSSPDLVIIMEVS